MNLIDYACMLRSAYRKYPDKWPRGYKAIAHTEHSTDTQLFMLIPPDCSDIIICIPGTESIRDALRDANRDRIHLGDNIRVKQGPFEAWASIAMFVNAQLNQYTHNRVVIVGHSLGAAIGDMLAFKLSRGGENVLPVMFGKYIIGNKEFYKEYAEQIPEYKDIGGKRDIVTGLFPWDLIAKNKHAPATKVLNCRHGIENYIRAFKQELPEWAV